jgi:hypothetical protein
MAAPTHNKNAEKWTEATVSRYLSKMIADVKENNIAFLGRAMINQGLSRKTWAYWREKYADVARIMERMDMLESTFEVHLFEGALESKHAASVAIFALKNNHHWTDRPQTLSEGKTNSEAVTPMIILDGQSSISL